jgi:hypothetical protein
LIHKWFGGELAKPKVTDLAKAIQFNSTIMNIPSNPLNMSLMLVIIEQQADFVPINKASLLEKFIEILLEKANPVEGGAGGIDYRNKEHFLSYVASRMVRDGNFRPTADEFRETAHLYFESRGLTVPGGTQPFIDHLISKGILSQDSGQICFGFRCFAEFFIAKYMIEDKSFYEQILSENTYLSYFQELDYLTGLQRNNRDLIDLIRDRTIKSLDSLLNHIHVEVNLERFDEIRVQQNVYEVLSEEEKASLTQQMTEEMSGDMGKQLVDLSDVGASDIDVYREKDSRSDQMIIKSTYNDYKSGLMENLLLYATVIKNCELIPDKQFKRDNLNTCVQSFLRAFYAYYAIMYILADIVDIDFIKRVKESQSDELPDDELPDEELPGEGLPDEEQEMRQTWKVGLLPLCLTLLSDLLYNSLGTPKLRIVLEEEIHESTNHVFLRLMYSVLYAELRLPGGIRELGRILKEVKKNKLYRGMILSRLSVYYVSKLHSPSELREMEGLLADAVMGDKDIPRMLKAKLMEKLRGMSPEELAKQMGAVME